MDLSFFQLHFSPLTEFDIRMRTQVLSIKIASGSATDFPILAVFGYFSSKIGAHADRRKAVLFLSCASLSTIRMYSCGPRRIERRSAGSRSVCFASNDSQTAGTTAHSRSERFRTHAFIWSAHIRNSWPSRGCPYLSSCAFLRRCTVSAHFGRSYEGNGQRRGSGHAPSPPRCARPPFPPLVSRSVQWKSS